MAIDLWQKKHKIVLKVIVNSAYKINNWSSDVNVIRFFTAHINVESQIKHSITKYVKKLLIVKMIKNTMKKKCQFINMDFRFVV